LPFPFWCEGAFTHRRDPLYRPSDEHLGSATERAAARSFKER
jgi:hypothetical protein